jgi:hypothetical protein
MKRFLPSSFVPLLLLATAACGEPEPTLTVGEVAYLEEELLGLSPAQRMDLAGLTAFGLAVSDGLWESILDPYRTQRLREVQVRHLAEEVTVQAAGLSEADLQTRYRINPRYELTVRHLIFLSERWESDAQRAEARRKAEAALQRAEEGEDFAALCAELSEEPGAAQRQGLLNPGRLGTWVPEFWSAANALRVGQISDVVESRYGFHVLRLEDRAVIPYQESRSSVVAEAAVGVGIGAPWNQWVEEQTRELEVVDAVLEMWTARMAEPTELVAIWRGGDLSVQELQRDLAASGYSFAAGVWSELVQAREATLELARLRALSQVAEEMGIRPTPEEVSGVDREFMESVTRWALTLGFVEGATREQVKAAARAAFGDTGQNARLARQEILEWAPLFVVTDHPVFLDGMPIP